MTRAERERQRQEFARLRGQAGGRPKKNFFFLSEPGKGKGKGGVGGGNPSPRLSGRRAAGFAGLSALKGCGPGGAISSRLPARGAGLRPPPAAGGRPLGLGRGGALTVRPRAPAAEGEQSSGLARLRTPEDEAR